MCELFGVSASKRTEVNSQLQEFFSHSVHHPNGWGMAVFHNGIASIEKEPVRADRSRYLKERLKTKIAVYDMIAHIRLATKGAIEYENCHPFVQQDNYGRRWTLAHNGTMFQCPVLDPYYYKQEGSTDSERILCYLIDRINDRQEELGRPLEEEERFAFLEEVVASIAEGNKLNLLLYDGELMYVHTNYADSLYYQEFADGAFFATVPLGKALWKPVPFTRLLAWKAGKKVYAGTSHGHEYIDNEKDMEFLFLDSSSL